MTDKKKKLTVPEPVAAMMAEANRQRGVTTVEPVTVEASTIDEDELTVSQEEMTDECSRYPETDLGLAYRFRIRYGDRLRHITHNEWHGFDGKRWKEDPAQSFMRPLAHRTAEFVEEEAIKLDCSEEEQNTIEAGRMAASELKALGKKAKEWSAEQLADFDRLTILVEAMDKVQKMRDGRMSSRHSFAKSAANSNRISNMISETKPYLSMAIDELNRDPYAFNVQNGTLRFFQKSEDGRHVWTVRIDRHRAHDFISKIAALDFDPNAACPVFDHSLTTWQPKQEMREFLQRYMGYCLLGKTGEHCLLFFYGEGRNGKSTFAELMADIFGDFAAGMSIDSFSGETQRRGADATPDLARLPGVRLVTAEEPEVGVKLKGALIKKMTGGTKMDVRRLNEAFFEFIPQFKLIISGNHKPIIVDDSDGMWARVKLVPWDVQIAENEIDKELPQKLRREAAGIFRWIVQGALDYLNQGLKPPQTVVEATQEYREESDPVGDFIRNGCEVTGKDDDFININELYAGFQKFARANAIFEMKSTRFKTTISKLSLKGWKCPDGFIRNFRKGKKNDVRGYLGIQILWRYRPSERERRDDDDDHYAEP